MIRFPRRIAGFCFTLAATVLLAACASTSNSPALFVLDGNQSPATTAHTSASPILMIAPVNVAPYLDQGGIVYQTAPHQIVIADNNRWASSLPGELTDNVYARLTTRLQDIHLVRATTRQHPGYKLDIRVDEFGGHFDGKAHIAGQWHLVTPSGETVVTRSFAQRVPLDQDGYPALVASLSRGWHKVADTMAPILHKAITTPDD